MDSGKNQSWQDTVVALLENIRRTQNGVELQFDNVRLHIPSGILPGEEAGSWHLNGSVRLTAGTEGDV